MYAILARFFMFLLSRRVVIMLITSLIASGVWYWNQRTDEAINSPTLAPDVKEKIIVDPQKKKITVITKERTDTLFLPNRPTAIEIPHKGPVRITRRTWGFELAPFGTVVFTDTLRAGAGVDVFYWQKLSAGFGAATNVRDFFDGRVFAQLSYNVYSNTSLGLVIDNEKRGGMNVSFRF